MAVKTKARSYRLQLSIAELRRAIQYVPAARRRSGSRVESPAIFVSAPKPDLVRPKHLNDLKRVFESTVAAMGIGSRESDLLLPPEQTLRYRDPWDLPDTGDFRETALRYLENASYVLGVASALTPGVAYELGFAMAKERPLALLWFKHQEASVMPFSASLLPDILRHLQIREISNGDLPEILSQLHGSLAQLSSQRRCPKHAADVECEYNGAIATRVQGARRPVIIAFQGRHRDQKDWLRRLVKESGFDPIDPDWGDRTHGVPAPNEGLLCRVCFTLRIASRVVVDVTRVPGEDGRSPTAEDRTMMIVAGMARGLGVDTLHLYERESSPAAMVDGQIGAWGSRFQSDLTQTWNDFLAATNYGSARDS